jgi:hypothetical protein
MKQSILLFNFQKQQSMKLMKALLPLKIRLKNIKESDFQKPVGVLAGIKDIDAHESEETVTLSDPMMLLCGFSGAQLDMILSAIRRSGAGQIPYKAVLTDSNKNWNAGELLAELKEEHEKMHS